MTTKDEDFEQMERRRGGGGGGVAVVAVALLAALVVLLAIAWARAEAVSVRQYIDRGALERVTYVQSPEASPAAA